jgi:hypothetical protein
MRLGGSLLLGGVIFLTNFQVNFLAGVILVKADVIIPIFLITFFIVT